MIANLIKKDFLLAKKSIVFILLFTILVPLIMVILMNDTMQVSGISALIFLYMLILSEISFMQAVVTEEEKYEKATALLCATPCSRKSYVVAKYICYLIFFAACIAIYSIIATVYSGLDFLNFTEALIVFLAGAIIYGIFTPIALKYGITKARLVFTVTILLTSLGPTLIAKVLHLNKELIMLLMKNITSVIGSIILGVSGFGILLISMIISIRVFEKKEL